MTYSEIVEQEFHYFSKEDEKIIEDFLKKKGYKWSTNTVCGSCCGMFADQYWVNGIGGDFKEKDRKALHTLLKEKGIAHSMDNSYHISADPEENDKYQHA